MKPYLVLGLETSCDETAASVVANGRQVLSDVIASQFDLHGIYGGVVPELASRRHVECVLPVIDQALREAGVKLSDIDAVAVSYGPGLAGALLVGVSAAKALAFSLNKPLVSVHHIEAHIAANYIAYPDLKPPFIALVASGGHSHIIAVESATLHRVIGRTRDDAAGEAFDKVARVLGLGYPGGPAIDKLASTGNPEAFRFPRVNFSEAPYDFSFSGLKTAVISQVNQYKQKNVDLDSVAADICASFQRAVIDVLVSKSVKAAIDGSYATLCLAGGVAANALLRSELEKYGSEAGLRVLIPSVLLCTDNAAMVACMGYEMIKAGFVDGLDLNAYPGLVVGMRT